MESLNQHNDFIILEGSKKLYCPDFLSNSDPTD